MDIKKLTDEQLKSEFEEYHDIVNSDVVAHGTNDVRWYYALQNELAERDIEYRTGIIFTNLTD